MADVLIKNMEMPKEPTYLVIYPEGKWQETTSSAEGRVIELPPHGDLCDKDELMNEVDSTYMWEQAVRKVRLAPVIVEASDGIDN